MKKLKIKLFSLTILFLLTINTIIVTGDNIKLANYTFSESIATDNFYFIQITDTHIKHKIFDRNEYSTTRLKIVLQTVTSFEQKPAFIVITGDLTEWGAGICGALNCIAFVNCFYEKDNQLYADDNFTIPVYTTPGNHDYVLQRNLNNYYKIIDKNHVQENDRYTVEYDNISLFFMNSGPNYYSNISILFDWHGQGLSNDDMQWLDEKLSNCTSERKIILMHHPAVGCDDDLFIENRNEFVQICETYDIEVVLAGHTHHSRIFDYNLTQYTDDLLNCSQLPTLYVQSDDCKDGIHYRNITIDSGNVLIEKSEELHADFFNLN